MIIYRRIAAVVDKVRKADIVKVFSFTAISTLVRMLTGLVSVKVVSIIIGPSGIAMLGQLSNFSSIIMNAASGGINNGVVKYVAEYKDSDEKIRLLLSTAFRITLYCSLICGILMILFNHLLSTWVMLDSKYGFIFIIFGLTITLYALNALLVSILNGFKEFKKYVYVNIAGSIIGLLFTLVFVFTLGLKGALISAVTFQSVIFFVSLWMIRKSFWIRMTYFEGKIDREIAKKYFKFALMSFVTVATAPVSQLLLRGYVISNISNVQAGWWEAMNRISGMYLMVLTSSFGVYYLPKLAEIKDDAGIRHEIFKAYKLIIPLLLVGFVVIYILRFFIIKILFTSAFLPMADLFVWQLIGDLFKISSWLLAFLMIAKSMTKTFIFTEIIFSGTMVGLGFIFLHFNGIVGLTQAYAVNYLLYFVAMVFVFRKMIFRLN